MLMFIVLMTVLMVFPAHSAERKAIILSVRVPAVAVISFSVVILALHAVTVPEPSRLAEISWVLTFFTAVLVIFNLVVFTVLTLVRPAEPRA
jgi:hypothetical protein